MVRGPKKRWSDAIIKPVKRTLFGDEGYQGAKSGPDAIDVVPIERIMPEVCALSWGDWTEYAFAREPLNGRLTDGTRRDLMERARLCGEDWAGRLAVRFETRSPLKIAEGLGVTVRDAAVPHGQDRVLFAEYVEPDEVYVYGDAMDKVRALLRRPQVREAVGPNMHPRALLIAHETFHVVELQRRDEVWTQSYRIDTLGIGPLHNRSRLVVLSEIAAMAFARTLLGIGYSPYVMDVLMTYAYSPAAGTSLYDEVMGYQRGCQDAPVADGRDTLAQRREQDQVRR